MDDYTDETYGETIAEIYDQLYSQYDPDAINTLAELSKGGKALELGIGTGRIAIPLMNSGVTVHGIDISKSMVAKLRAKPGGEKIPVTFGNIADVAVEGKFSLIYVVFNTFFSLLTQEEQVRCFENVTRHLMDDGVFLIEAFVPDLKRFTGGQAIRAVQVGNHEAKIDISILQSEKQIISSQHTFIGEHGTRFYPVKIRYVWPAEMDLMGRISHLHLKERWSDWKKSPFTDESTKHISIYEQMK
jgi:SAM-dependent methyltransferase